MRRALKHAERAAGEGEVPVGCVIVREGKVVGWGRNRREGRKNALAHAEIEAISRACRKLGGWRLPGCTLYVTLEPCPMCAGAIVNARIERVCFGAPDAQGRGLRQRLYPFFLSAQPPAGLDGRHLPGGVRPAIAGFFPRPAGKETGAKAPNGFRSRPVRANPQGPGGRSVKRQKQAYGGTIRLLFRLRQVRPSTRPACRAGRCRRIFSSGQSHHRAASRVAITSSENRLRISLAGTPPTMV